MISIIKSHINEHFKIKNDTLDMVLCVLLSGGNLLLTDEPGTGKTTLAKILSDLFSLNYGRVQFTPDISPSDVTGINVFNQENRSWELHKGPLFNDILLVDEINRALPRAQSALLEAMAEKQTTIDRTTYSLSPHFFVIATQNPLEEEGMFDLPSAQKDRFSMNLSLNHLSRDDELAVMLGEFDYKKQNAITSVEELMNIKNSIKSLPINKDVADYALRMIESTRTHSDIEKGVSVRAGKDLINNAKALAYIRGDEQVLPDHIFALAKAVLNHRIVVKNNYNNNAERINEVLDSCIKKVNV